MIMRQTIISSPDNFKNAMQLVFILIVLLSFFIVPSCEKPERTVKITTLDYNPSDITFYTAVVRGELTDLGSQIIEDFGIVLSLNVSYLNPVQISKDTIPSKKPFKIVFNSLQKNTTYHYKAYVRTKSITTYGISKQFKTNESGSPVLVTTTVTGITASEAKSGGSISSDGGETITKKGICWSENTGTDLTNCIDSTVNLTDAVTWESVLTGLDHEKTYYVRSYAINSKGTGYGNELSFITKAPPPPVTDYDGNVYNVVQIGTQFWIQRNLMTTHYNNGDVIPDITDNTEWSLLGTGALSWFNNDEATYKNTQGAIYNWYSAADVRNLCPTGWHVPSNTDLSILSDFLGGNTVAGGKMKEEGFAHWISPNTGADNSSGFTAISAGYRIYTGIFYNSPNSGSWWTGSDCYITAPLSFGLMYNSSALLFWVPNYGPPKYGFSIRCVKGELPLTKTDSATAVASTSTTLNGKINPNGASTTVTFEYGTTNSYGTEIAATQIPVPGSVPVNVSSELTGLTPGITYHYRIKGVNSGGTGYGADITFTTPATVTDYESNVYNTVKIGAQTWMQENLKSTKYSDGTDISGYWAYGNDLGNVPVYGYLYYWYAVMNGASGSDLNPSGVQGVCPTGWHVPSASEWIELSTFLGTDQGGKLKEAGLDHWADPNTGATNESGFSALPGGGFYQNPNLGFRDIVYWASFWTSTFVNDMVECTAMGLYYNNPGLGGANVGKANAFSIRCVKD